MRLKFKFVPMGIGLLAVAIGAGAAARTPQYSAQTHPAAAMKAAPSAHVSPQTLMKFKRAYRSVMRIEKTYSMKVEHTHNRKVAMSLRQRAQTKMVNAVKSSGLTVAQYDKLMTRMQRNPAFRKRVLGH